MRQKHGVASSKELQARMHSYDVQTSTLASYPGMRERRLIKDTHTAGVANAFDTGTSTKRTYPILANTTNERMTLTIVTPY